MLLIFNVFIILVQASELKFEGSERLSLFLKSYV